jgi:hypothetical protein
LDLEEYRKVPREDGILAAKKYNMAGFIEVSSKTGQNIDEVFNLMTEVLFERYVYPKNPMSFD